MGEPGRVGPVQAYTTGVNLSVIRYNSSMRSRILEVVIVLGVVSLLIAMPSPPPIEEIIANAIKGAIEHENRPEEDKQRDADRKPAEVLTFAGLRPQMTVADLMAGGGYYTEIVARAVGDNGKVYAQNNAVALQRFADRAMNKRLEGRDLKNVVRLDRELEDLGIPERSVDLAMLVLFYHDTYWMNVDRRKMNEQVMKALKPGGIYLVIDHHAEEGSGDRDVKTLHRVDAAMVKKEVLAAGFEWVGDSNVLRYPDDDRKTNVFDPKIRGKTDQFTYKFRKPREKKQ